MSKETLKKFVVTGRSAEVHGGLVRLTAAQAKPRLHNLTAVDVGKEGVNVGAGVYEVRGRIQFKNGEQFEYDGQFPKAMAAAIADPKEVEKDQDSGKMVKKAKRS